MSSSGPSSSGAVLFPRHALLVALLVVLVAGCAVRVIGLRHGEPDLVFHPDVAKQTRAARHFFHGHNHLRGVFEDDVNLTMYPYGMSVLLGRGWRAYAAVSGDASVDKVHRWTWALRMRHLSLALFLGASAFSLWLVSRRWTWVAMSAAGLLLWLEPVNVQMSHYGMNDVPLAGLLLLAWALASRMGGEPLRFPWASLACGFVLGFAFGVKYQAVLGILFPAVAWSASVRARDWPRACTSLAALAATFLAGVLVSCPLLVADPAYFFDSFVAFMAWQGNIMGEDLPMTSKALRNVMALVEVFTAPGYLAFLALGAAGCIAVLSGPRRGRAPAVSALLFCVLLTGVILLGRDFVRANDLLPIFAFLAVGAAPALLLAWGCGRWGRVAFVAVAAVAIGSFGITSLLDSLALARPDTRVRAQAWCREHMQDHAEVLRERYTLPVGREDLREHNVLFLGAGDPRYLVEHGDVDYLVASSLAHERFGDPRSAYYDPDTHAFYQDLDHRFPVVARFTDRDLLFAHPTVTVYRREEP